MKSICPSNAARACVIASLVLAGDLLLIDTAHARQWVRERLPPEVRLILTHELDANNQPIDDIDRMSISHAGFITYAHLFQLVADRPHEVLFRLLNARGEPVASSRLPLEVAQEQAIVTIPYQLRSVDSPGVWQIELWLDGKLLADRQLRLTQPD